VLDALKRADRPLSTVALESRVDLRRGRLEMMLKVLDVDGAVRRVKGGWTATGQEWTYDRDRYRRVAQARGLEASAMREYAGLATCRLEFLRRALDDPFAAPCGRCDICAGPWYDAGLPEGALDRAAAHLRRPGVAIEPRRLWPTGGTTLGVPASGKIDPAEAADAGRAVGRLTDLGWGGRLRELLGARDSEVPDDVFKAVVATLAAWDWDRRPVAIAGVASRTRPRLVGSLARRLAQVGRLVDLGDLVRVGGGAPGAGAARAERAPRHGPGTESNSVQRLAAVWDAFAVPDGMVASLSSVEGPVLLVDDLVDSGWTMTVAVRALRRAGTSSVLPFALATTT
jgi:ATP-dependent DNA helicase RecQ